MRIVFCNAESSSTPLLHVTLRRIAFYEHNKEINSDLVI